MKGDPGAAPYVISSLCLVLKTLPFLPLTSDIRKDRFVRRIAIFVIFATCASFLYPHIWIGSDVHSYIIANSAINVFADAEKFWILPFGMGYILVFLSMYCVYKNRMKIPDNFTEKAFLISIIVVVLIGFWEFTAKTTGVVDFPYDIFYNNAWYSQLYMQVSSDGLMRLNSTFLEPSYCGSFLSASFWAIMVFDKQQYKWLCILVGIALIFNLSATGMVSFIFGFFIYVFFYLKDGIRYIIPFIIIGLLLVWIISEIDYFENMGSMLINKKDSVSGLERGAATYLTWEVFLQTYGIGVGLGVVEGSSLLLNILASLGILGVFLLYGIYTFLWRNIERQHQWSIIFMVVVLCGQCIAAASFSYPIMRMYLFMTAALVPQQQSNATS
jgi:hypothetical protein